MRKTDNPTNTLPPPREAGFTLVELLTVISIIAILAGISIQTFKEYRDRSYRTLARQLLNQSRTALEAGKNDVDNALTVAFSHNQLTSGVLDDPTARRAMPNIILPSDVEFSFSTDPTCDTAGCLSDYISVQHCRASTYSLWQRTGDGIGTLLTDEVGGGC